MKKLWSLFSSIKTAVVLFFLIALTSIIGTLIQQQPNPTGYERVYGPSIAKIIKALELYDMYHSWWFQLLIVLFAINLIVCSFDRLPKILRFFKKENRIQPIDYAESLQDKCRIRSKKGLDHVVEGIRSVLSEFGFGIKEELKQDDVVYLFSEKGLINRLGVYATHFSILIILIGGLIGSIFGFTGNMVVVEGEKSRNVVLRGGVNNKILPFEIKCEKFEIVYYKNRPEVPKEYISKVKVIDNGKVVMEKNIEVNHPLKYKGIYFYQASYGVYSSQEGILTLAIRDKNTGKRYTVSVMVGEKVKIDDTPYEVKLIAFYPDFVLTESGQPTTRSDELRNPAALLEVLKGDKPLYRTWVFAFFPNVHSKKNTPFEFKFLGFKPTFYTVFQVSKDPGVWLVWLGCILMVISIFITFFMSHKRIFVWVRDKGKDREVIIGFSVNRNREAFKKKAENICNKLKEVL